MSQKTITIISMRQNISIDLDGFADNSCSGVFEDFRGGDKIKTERKKNSFYSAKQTSSGPDWSLKAGARCCCTDSVPVSSTSRPDRRAVYSGFRVAR